MNGKWVSEKKFGAAISALNNVNFKHGSLREAIGRKLCATGKQYSACVNEHERNGWVQEFAARIDAARVGIRQPDAIAPADVATLEPVPEAA